MKITEPKTPYEDEPQNPEKDIEVEDEIEQDLIEAQINKQKLQQQQKLDIEELNKRLQQDLERERKQMDRDSDDEEEKKKKHEDFIKKRKQHYNEKNVIRAALHKKLEDN